MPQQTTKQLVQTWLLTLPVSTLLCLLVFPKRKLLIDATELTTYPEYIPWYYAPFHCENMPPWNEIYTGDPFCIAIDVRLVVLLPLAVSCLLTYMWCTQKTSRP